MKNIFNFLDNLDIFMMKNVLRNKLFCSSMTYFLKIKYLIIHFENKQNIILLFNNTDREIFRALITEFFKFECKYLSRT